MGKFSPLQGQELQRQADNLLGQQLRHQRLQDRRQNRVTGEMPGETEKILVEPEALCPRPFGHMGRGQGGLFDRLSHSVHGSCFTSRIQSDSLTPCR